MKKLLSILTVPALSGFIFAQEFQAPAILSMPDGETQQVYITAATKTQIRYKTTAVATEFKDANIADFTTIFLMNSPEYSAAVDLFEGRKYEEAREKFAEIKATTKPIATLKDNHHTLSAFYEMECMRKLGDYESLATALQGFTKEPLSRDHQLRQLDLYVMWDAVRTESWDKLLLIASERDGETLPGDHRAQVAYCKGLALDKLNRGSEALVEYGKAITADAGASEKVTQEAALNSLGIYAKDKGVQEAMAAWGTGEENKNSPGYSRLLEAAGLAKFYEKFLTVGKPLTEETKVFLKYGEETKASKAAE
jgi:hypothetical protein